MPCQSLVRILLCSVLLAGLATCAAVAVESPPSPTQVSPVQFKDGMALPKRPWKDVVKDAFDVLRKSDGAYVPGRLSSAIPGYFLSAYIMHDGSKGPELAYPARHHAYFIRIFLRYYAYTGQPEWLLRAKDLADWEIAHSTPPTANYAQIPYSTYSLGKGGGAADGKAIEPDKAAFFGTAYLCLFDATGEARYRQAALRIANCLVAHQKADGSWPFRVVPDDGTVLGEFGGAPVFFVEFFEYLSALENRTQYTTAWDKALKWMLETNVQADHWGTYHEDITAQPANYSSAEPMCFTAYYLLRHAGRDPDYQAKALSVVSRIQKRFVHTDHHPMAPAPAVAEQPKCNHIMPGHTARYCAVLAELFALTGDNAYRRAALSGLNGITYVQTEAGLFRTWIWNVNQNRQTPHRDWYSQHLFTVCHLFEAMARLPELIPDDESRLVETAVPVKRIEYGQDRVTFETTRPSTAVLKLAFSPTRVTVNGNDLNRAPRPGQSEPGWSFDPKTHVIHVSHEKGIVEVR